MKDTINSAKLSTYILVKYYQKVLEFECTDRLDSEEFEELISKMKQCLETENKLYHDLSLEEIKKCLDESKDIKIDNDNIARYYSKLNYQRRVKEQAKQTLDGDILLSGVISAKLTIDILKELEKKIAEIIDNPDVSEEDSDMLRLTYINNKYLHIISNPYLESYAINYNFDVNSIPSISFDDIETAFNAHFKDNIRSILASYVLDSISELYELKNDNKYYITYKNLLELSRVEIILPYLDLKTIQLIESKYEIKQDNNITVRNIKKKIKQRKEELNN